MKEQEAIERIAKAFKRDAPGCSHEYLTARATTAWNEMKAIAREDANKCRVVPGLRRLDTERKAAERGYL